MFLQLVTKYSRVIALLGICAVIAVLSPNFLTVSNLVNVLRQAALTAIIATGMTLTMLIAGIDLSVGSILALTTCLAADFLKPDLPLGYMFLGVGIALGWELSSDVSTVWPSFTSGCRISWSLSG